MVSMRAGSSDCGRDRYRAQSPFVAALWTCRRAPYEEWVTIGDLGSLLSGVRFAIPSLGQYLCC